MNDQEIKFLEDVEVYRAATLRLRLGRDMDVQNKFDGWRDQVLAGHAEDGSLRGWISSLITYYQEKDRPFAEYLEGLMK